jgi:fused signal recognition particle receptor
MEWHEVFRGVEGHVPLEVVEEEELERPGLFRRLRANLGKARASLRDRLRLIVFSGLDDELWAQVEEVLLAADVGVAATQQIVEELERRAALKGLQSSDELVDEVAAIMADMLRPEDPVAQLIDIAAEPAVILVVGVNGTGKTTTIGKLAYRLKQMGKVPLMVAADTFRAAAAEQLTEWAGRVGCDIVRQAAGGDPAAVVYDGITAARSRNADVVIVDTAGRLHTQINLMNELAKVRRVVEKQLPGAPHETLLVLDATTGQNGLRQAEEFGQAVQVSGIVLTKLDGTAKGGIVLAIHERLGIPIKLIGIGEQLEDLRPFDADEFTRALLSSES